MLNRTLEKTSLVEREAAKLFDKIGYLETSLKDVSKASKLSKGGIYHYFSNKHEILFSIINNYLDHLLEGLEDDLKKIDDLSSKIEFIVFRHLQMYNKKSPEAKATLIYSRNLPSKYFKIIAKKQKQYAQVLTDILEEFFKDADGIKKEKAKAISYSLFGMCNSIMYWYDPKGKVTLEELSRIIYDIFMKGVSGYRNHISAK
ncbi:MAG: TetR/AcrR family transcriptional regulator [Syntrophales bacterium]